MTKRGNTGHSGPPSGKPANAALRRLRRRWRLRVARLGPGLITGAADDDPSGIATYSQAGAQFGTNMLWTPFFTYPLMVAIQVISARIGRVTGRGLAANLLAIFPRWVASALVLSLFVANIVNIGADLAAMGAAAELLVGGGQLAFTIGAGILSLLLQIFLPYHSYVRYLKWLTLVLFTYVGVVFAIQIDWIDVLTGIVAPQFDWSPAWVTVVVAVFGTTISPYLFFWQTSEEVEEMEINHRPVLRRADHATARREIRRMTADTFTGMAVSNVIAFFIMLTTALTLHRAGVTDIETSEQAAQALRPIAGSFAFLLFSLGIIGTGLLAVPVLAGSAAYAVCETFGWPEGLEKKASEARGFYAVIAASILIALGVVFSPLNPIQALFWSAVLNGIVAVPIMGAMMILAARRRQMGHFVASLWQRVLGWAATIVMALAVVAMFVLG